MVDKYDLVYRSRGYDSWRAMVLEASQTMQMRDEYQEWDEFERLAATVLQERKGTF